jgi:hypothetical protein
MPAVNAFMPDVNTIALDVAVPTHARRRVWSHPEVKSHSLVVLTFDRLHVAPLTGTPKADTLAAIESGADLDTLFGPLAIVVDLVAVKHVKLDLLTNSLMIEYASGGVGTRWLTIVFAKPETADACFTKLWRRLGDGCQLMPYQRDSWSLARAPLMFLVGILLATAAMALVLSVFEDMASARAAAQVSTPGLGGMGNKGNLPQSPLEVLFGWLDWRVVCGVGGVAAAATQIWLYRRLTRPPLSLELLRGA